MRVQCLAPFLTIPSLAQVTCNVCVCAYDETNVIKLFPFSNPSILVRSMQGRKKMSRKRKTQFLTRVTCGKKLLNTNGSHKVYSRIKTFLQTQRRDFGANSLFSSVGQSTSLVMKRSVVRIRDQAFSLRFSSVKARGGCRSAYKHTSSYCFSAETTTRSSDCISYFVLVLKQ